MKVTRATTAQIEQIGAGIPREIFIILALVFLPSALLVLLGIFALVTGDRDNAGIAWMCSFIVFFFSIMLAAVVMVAARSQSENVIQRIVGLAPRTSKNQVGHGSVYLTDTKIKHTMNELNKMLGKIGLEVLSWRFLEGYWYSVLKEPAEKMGVRVKRFRRGRTVLQLIGFDEIMMASFEKITKQP